MEQVDGRPVIAIAGATGDLGSHLVKMFLANDGFSQPAGLILLSRRHTPRTEEWKLSGAQIRIIDEAGDIGELVDALEGVDVLVNWSVVVHRLRQCRDADSRAVYHPQERD